MSTLSVILLYCFCHDDSSCGAAQTRRVHTLSSHLAFYCSATPFRGPHWKLLPCTAFFTVTVKTMPRVHDCNLPSAVLLLATAYLLFLRKEQDWCHPVHFAGMSDINLAFCMHLIYMSSSSMEASGNTTCWGRRAA